MNQAKLTALDCRFDNSVNVYFVGEQPGDSAEPLCSRIEDDYIEWLENYQERYMGAFPADVVCVRKFHSLIQMYLPKVEINSVAVLHRQP